MQITRMTYSGVIVCNSTKFIFHHAKKNLVDVVFFTYACIMSALQGALHHYRSSF